MLKQVSIYAENKKGTMEHITGVLAAGDINILGSVTNDSAEFGIIRMVTTDPEKAIEILEKEGLVTAAQGKGYYVNAQNSEMLREQHLRKVEDSLNDAINSAKIANITESELIETLKALYMLSQEDV